MPTRSAFIDRILADGDLLEKLHPTEPGDAAMLREIRAAKEEEILGGKKIADAESLAVLRAALFYAHDAIDEAHRLVQHDGSGAGAYLHGMIHRREGDFDNARYWFRRSGRLGFFDELHAAAANISADFAKQQSWDAYLFTGLCEQDKFGDRSRRAGLVQIQRAELNAFVDYVFGKSAGG